MNVALAFKAEVVLAVQLITRHRAPRLAMLLAGSLVVMLLVDAAPGSLNTFRRTVILIAGALSAVSASRLFAHGGALASVRRTASPWLLAPAGRLTGLLLFTALTVFSVSAIVLGSRWGALEAVRTAALLVLYCAAVAAPVMAVTPALGASASAALGLISALVGEVRPSEVAAMLEPWPLGRGVAVTAWNVLPLPWRSERWLAAGGLADPLVLLVWVAVGLTLTGYVAGAAPGSRSSGSPS